MEKGDKLEIVIFDTAYTRTGHPLVTSIPLAWEILVQVPHGGYTKL
jgi:hypothetical protein